MGDADCGRKADALAAFCAELLELRELAAEAGRATGLTAIVAAARLDRDLPNALTQLHELLHQLRVAAGLVSREKLEGKKPKLTARQQAELVRVRGSGEYSIADLVEMFSAGRAMVDWVLERAGRDRADGVA